MGLLRACSLEAGGHRGSEELGLGCDEMAKLGHQGLFVIPCAAAGTTWLLQLIEDVQQSQAFHETCELKLPRGQAAKIPEVGSCYDCRTAVPSHMHMHMCIQFIL